MRKCNNDKGCPGHVEKFEGCDMEALYYSDADKTTGDTEAHGYYMLHVLTEDEELNVDDDHTVIVSAGVYLLMTDEQGFVYFIDGTDEELLDYFENAEKQYDEWCEKNMEYV